MTGLWRVGSVRMLEAALRSPLPPGEAMRRAGLAAAGHVRRLAGSRRRVLVLAGPGDNGGDGAVCAAALARDGFEVAIAHTDPPPGTGAAASAPVAQPGSPGPGLDRAAAWAALPDSVRRVHDPREAPSPQVIVDALFGIGLSRALAPPWRDWIAWANAREALRVALDVPSGLDADTGSAAGEAFAHDAEPVVFDAHETITFVADKPGLHTGRAPDHAGRVRVETLGADASAHPADGALIDAQALRRATRRLRRRAAAHKGDAGLVALVGGAPGMAGAIVLAARAALALGAGRVRAGFVGGAPVPYDALHPEAMLSDAHAALQGAPTVVAVGPGLGRAPEAGAVLQQAVQMPCALLLDADALNLLAGSDALRAACAARSAPTVATPHPLEAARLLGTDTRMVQRDRIAAACRLAGQLRAVVVLKGAGTVVADAAGRWWINPTGSAALASGGTGDVLAGMGAALLAQSARGAGLDADATLEAMLAAVWLHGAAGQAAAAQVEGELGVMAGELAGHARRALNALVAQAR